MDSLMENDNEIGNILEKLSVEEYDKGKLFGIFRGLYGEKMDYKSHKEIYRFANKKKYDFSSKKKLYDWRIIKKKF